VTSSNIGKFYHGNLMERVQILVLALCGTWPQGRRLQRFPFLTQDGSEIFALMKGRGCSARPGCSGRHAHAARGEEAGMTDEMVRYETGNLQFRRGAMVSA